MRFKRILFILCSLLFTCAYAGNGVTIKTVVIDAGHGGKDPGATGPDKINEKDVALAVALKLGEYIQKNFPDVNVIYTRKTDVFLELHERADIANQKKADLFICVHCNSSPNPQTYGTSTYVLGLHRTEANLEVAKRENSVILLEDDRDKNYEFDPNTPEGHIIMSMKQNAFLDQSIDIASKIENQFETAAKRKSLGVKQAGFYVLYKTAMPSLLSEIGFISNPQEEKFLNSSKGQEQIANALLKAFTDYKFEMENSKGEQVAYEEAKKKSESNDTALQKAVTALQSKNTQPENEQATEVKKEAAPAPVKTTETKANPMPVSPANGDAGSDVVILSGRRIRKPIENSSGGGTAESEKPKEEPAPVKVEKPKVIEADNKKPEKDTTVVAPKPVEAVKVEPKATEVKNSSEALRNEVKASPAEKKVVVKEPAPVAKKEPKPVEPVKPAPKPAVVSTAKPKAITRPEDIPTHTAENGIVFKVQLFAVKTLKQSEFQKVSKVFTQLSTEELPSQIVRYYAGDAKTYNEAKQDLETATSHGYKDAFIVGFKNGVRMSPNQLKTQETR